MAAMDMREASGVSERSADTRTLRVGRGLAAVGGFTAFGAWLFTLLGGFGTTLALWAVGVLIVTLLVGVFIAVATDDGDWP